MSNAPWAGTGYGAQTKLILKSLLDIGHKPTCFAFYGLAGGKLEYDGYTVLPNSDFDPWGNDVVGAHIQRSKSDCVISLIDPFVLDTKIWTDLDVPWLAWTPIDSEGIGPALQERLKSPNCSPIAMSDFGVQQMNRYDINVPARIYHAVDTEVFHPMDKNECREFFTLPDEKDAYIIGMVMANKGDRKQYPVQLRAISEWWQKNKDVPLYVFIHTEPTSMSMGWGMKDLVKYVGLEGRVLSTNQYDVSVVPFSTDQMAMLYNCFDLLMNVSAGEGFGIPIVEAQACGVPVMAGNFTSMPELVKNGVVIDPLGKTLAPHYGYQFGCDPRDIQEALDVIYRTGYIQTDAQMGRQWVIENCGLPVITDDWAEVLFEVERQAAVIKMDAQVSL